MRCLTLSEPESIIIMAGSLAAPRQADVVLEELRVQHLDQKATRQRLALLQAASWRLSSTLGRALKPISTVMYFLQQDPLPMAQAYPDHYRTWVIESGLIYLTELRRQELACSLVHQNQNQVWFNFCSNLIVGLLFLCGINTKGHCLPLPQIKEILLTKPYTKNGKHK